MKTLSALALLAAAAPMVDAVAAPAAIRNVVRRGPARPAAPAAWISRVSVTADGGFRVGNPGAKVRFVEYGSLSCPYCQRFHQESTVGLRAKIATGAVRFEFHPFAVHSADPILHALLRCAGPARFVKFSDDFYDGQTALIGAYEDWIKISPTINPNATAADRIRYADKWGFTAFAVTHGLTRARVAACLSNVAAFRLQEQREDIANKERGVASTPTFFINGEKLTSYAWPDIDQAIVAALD